MRPILKVVRGVWGTCSIDEVAGQQYETVNGAGCAEITPTVAPGRGGGCTVSPCAHQRLVDDAAQAHSFKHDHSAEGAAPVAGRSRALRLAPFVCAASRSTTRRMPRRSPTPSSIELATSQMSTGGGASCVKVSASVSRPANAG